jgi:Na+/proline symporter
MFNLSPDSAYPVVVIMAIILIFEWVGGLSSVALTDCVQAVVMIFTFISVPLVIMSKFYGWKDIDPYEYPIPEYYQTPSRETQWDFWQFSFINFSFFTLPHLMQRTYAAADLRLAVFIF